MTTPTYDLIQSLTLTTAVGEVTFSPIPQNFRHLVLIINCGVNGGGEPFFRINGDGSNDYYGISMSNRGNQLSRIQDIGETQARLVTMGPGVGSSSQLSTLKFFDYSRTDKTKNISIKSANVDASLRQVIQVSNTYDDTSAVTSMTFFVFGSTRTIASGSTFNLYGIAA